MLFIKHLTKCKVQSVFGNSVLLKEPIKKRPSDLVLSDWFNYLLIGTCCFINWRYTCVLLKEPIKKRPIDLVLSDWLFYNLEIHLCIV